MRLSWSVSNRSRRQGAQTDMQQVQDKLDFPIDVPSDAELRKRFEEERGAQQQMAARLAKGPATQALGLSRGRGNQGRQAKVHRPVEELDHHKAHNDLIREANRLKGKARV